MEIGSPAASHLQREPFQCLFIRAIRSSKQNQLVGADRFASWHDPGFDPKRDPILSDKGVREQELRLKRTIEEFEPDLVVVSPSSAALQTAMVACSDVKVPIIAHADLQNFKKKSKPKHYGLEPGALAAAIGRCGGLPVDLSELAKGWCMYAPGAQLPSKEERQAPKSVAALSMTKVWLAGDDFSVVYGLARSVRTCTSLHLACTLSHTSTATLIWLAVVQK